MSGVEKFSCLSSCESSLRPLPRFIYGHLHVYNIPTVFKVHAMSLIPDHNSGPSSLVSSNSTADSFSTDKTKDSPAAHTPESITLDDPDNPAEPANPKQAATHVRICPHHTLSFEELNQLATTPLLEENRSLDMLVKLHPPHHHKVKDNTKPRLCSHIYFRNTASFEPGFELTACWIAVCSRLKYGEYSKDDIRQMLGRSKVWLCSHSKLCNTWVINAMVCILKRNQGGRTYEGLKGMRIDCEHCKAAIQVRCLTEKPLEELSALLQVSTKRQLGKGLREDDDQWQKYCVPVADDMGNGSRSDEQREFHCGTHYIRGIIHPSA